MVDERKQGEVIVAVGELGFIPQAEECPEVLNLAPGEAERLRNEGCWESPLRRLKHPALRPANWWRNHLLH